MPYPPLSPRLRRREVIKTGLGVGAAALMPWRAARAELPPVPRDRTMILVWGGREGRWVDWDLWNPYSIGSNHQNGPNLIYEPLAYCSAFADKTAMWLAESYEFTGEFKHLTIKTRSGISWSDGQPFGAEDVAYTLNSLRDLGPKVRWGDRRPAGRRQGRSDRPEHGGDRLQDPVAALFLLHDLQIRHRRLRRTEAHFRWPRLDDVQEFRPGEKMASQHGAMAGR
jgi:hypothetical protein